MIPSSTNTLTSIADLGIIMYVYIQERTTTSLKVLEMSYTNIPSYAGDPAALTNNNPYRPHTLNNIAEPGYALLSSDLYYAYTAVDRNPPAFYLQPPPDWATRGVNPPSRR